MFKAPTEEESLKVIEESEKAIDEAIRFISKSEPFPEKKVHLLDWITSGPVNKGFNRLYIKADKFRYTDACVHCGVCENVCPLGNIHYINERPVWGDECTHCMACISKCPQRAIEYGRKTVGKGRYICPK